MAILWRVWAAVAAVNLIVLAVFVALAALRFDAIHSTLLGERIVMLATRTAAPFEQAALLGLGLQTVRNADALLERARQTDDAIAAIHVFDTAGRILRSTDRQPPPSIPAPAVAARRASTGAPWHVEIESGFLSGVDILSRTGDSVGGVMIAYSSAQNVTRVGAMLSELILAAIIVLLVGTALAVLLLRLGLRRQIHAFEGIEREIADFERDAWRTAAGATTQEPADAGGESVRGALDAVERQYRETGHALGALRVAP